MSYELKQELKLTQRFVMTPQLQLAIKLLQLSRLELEELVKEEVQANPVLEDVSDSGTEAPPVETKDREVDWQAYLEEYSDYRDPGPNFRDEQEEQFFDNVPASTRDSLDKHLMWQLGMAGLSAEALKVGEFIIGNIDDDGYLRVTDRGDLDEEEFKRKTVEEIAGLTGSDVKLVEEVLGIIQQFDPPGVGARTVGECLLHQAMLLPVRDTLVEEIIRNHLDRLARRNFKAIAKALGVSVDEVAGAARTINKYLNPSPGSGFGADEARAIVPDVYVYKVGNEYVIALNEDGLPRLRISPYYKRLLKEGAASCGDAKGYIQEKLRSALWLIKSVHQRQRTICRVVESLVKFQRDFLDHGLKHLRPLVLKDVAEDIGVHESTVSRVTSNKYVQTPRGLFELKYFFSTAMSGADGNNVAVEYIKDKIKHIIKNEDRNSPLSDQQIADRLGQMGIPLARRTVTKYREALGFQSASRRKVGF